MTGLDELIFVMTGDYAPCDDVDNLLSDAADRILLLEHKFDRLRSRYGCASSVHFELHAILQEDGEIGTINQQTDTERDDG